MNYKNPQKLNAFGDIIYSPIEILSDQDLARILKPVFLDICKELKVKNSDAQELLSSVWRVDSNTSINDFEDKLKNYFSSLVPKANITASLEKRARLIAKQVSPYLEGNNLADIGCGDGLVAWYLREKFNTIVLSDIHNYLDTRVHLPFYLYIEGEPLSFKNSVDTVMLLTVLHHANNPVALVKAIREITISKAIIIESVFGIVPQTNSPKSVLFSLSKEQQRKYASFVDWLYNRVFHDNVQVPYNYTTPDNWKSVFESTGWRVKLIKDLGIDQPIVPEHHFLFVLDAL